MSDQHPSEPEHPHHETGFMRFLEKGDDLAHFLVSGLLLLTAFAVLIVGTGQFIHEVAVGDIGAKGFATDALEYLNNLLFAVILLELLSTLLTYIKSKNLEATIKDFLIVGIISCVRKILLVGAHSSLEKLNLDDFQKEAIGTAVTIVGILLLIGGLILLEWRRVGRKKAEASSD